MATNYMGMSAKTLQPIVTQTQTAIEGLRDVVGKWAQGISTLTVASESLTNQTTALHGHWGDAGGDAFAVSSANDVKDMTTTAQAMVDAKVGELYVALTEAAKGAVDAINTVMGAAAAATAGGTGGGPGGQAAAGAAALVSPADLVPPPEPIPAAMQALIAAMPPMGTAMVQALANAQGKWPPGAGQDGPGSSPSASPGATPGGSPTDAGAQQGGQQAGGQQAGGEQAGGEQAGGEQPGQEGAVPPGGEPGLQGGPAAPVLPPPTTTPLPPFTPSTPPTTPLTPFTPIGGIGGGIGGGGGGGIGGGGGGGGPKNIPVAASPLKAAATPAIGVAPSLSGSSVGGTASTGTAGAGGYGGMPMMPMSGMGGGGGGGPKPGTGPRSVTGRGGKPSSSVPGLPPTLQGKAGSVDRNAFPAPSKPTLRERNEDTGKLELLDEEMWQVDETPAASNEAAPVRRLLQ